MSQEDTVQPIARKAVVLEIPGMEAVTVRGAEYATSASGPLTLDLYMPPAAKEPPPVVVLVAGYRDAGFRRFLGCRFKEMASSVSWARLAAASGLAAVTYEVSEPGRDLDALLRFLRENAASLGIDAARLGLWASSGNVPLALSRLEKDRPDAPACGAFLYGYTLDLGASTHVAAASAAFGFSNPGLQGGIGSLRPDAQIFLTRAGRDEMPHLNESLDAFVAAALSCNLPVTVVNHPNGPHAFDLLDDSAASRHVIHAVLAFLRASLSR